MLREVISDLQPRPELDELVEACVTHWEAAAGVVIPDYAEPYRPPTYSGKLRVALAITDRLHARDMGISVQRPYEQPPRTVVKLRWCDRAPCQERMVTAIAA